MVQEIASVAKKLEIAQNTFSLQFISPEIARTAVPGQFVNIKIDRSTIPLLRRPMSICDIEGETVTILFNVVGRGTSMLARTMPGESLDVLGPLGNGYNIAGDFDLAIMVAGGLGVAPFPFLTRVFSNKNVKVVSFVGARTGKQLAVDGLRDVSIATDDGSKGYQGTVVDLLHAKLPECRTSRSMIFSCGPIPMLKALQDFVRETRYSCEVSLETPMACGIGICQGCPVEMSEGPRKYRLACKEGPVFDISKIVI